MILVARFIRLSGVAAFAFLLGACSPRSSGNAGPSFVDGGPRDLPLDHAVDTTAPGDGGTADDAPADAPAGDAPMADTAAPDTAAPDTAAPDATPSDAPADSPGADAGSPDTRDTAGDLNLAPDLPGADLPGADLPGADLRDALPIDLFGADTRDGNAG